MQALLRALIFAPLVAMPAAGGSSGSSQELVLCVENRTPNKEAFQFARVLDGLQRAGQYALEYSVAPAPQGQVCLGMDGWLVWQGARAEGEQLLGRALSPANRLCICHLYLLLPPLC